jgi:PRTRC genetic system protein A
MTRPSEPLDPRDAALLAHVPITAVPRHTNFPPLAESGHRYLAGSDGLYLEVKRPWLHVCHHLAEVSLPYGEVTNARELTFDDATLFDMIGQFVNDARACLPHECAAIGVYDERDECFTYVPLRSIDASSAHVNYLRPALAPHQHLAFDFHSHGRSPAFFSLADNIDDHGEVKVAVVIGNLYTRDLGGNQTSRLCLPMGVFINLDDCLPLDR